jgi:hypothetical protein
MRGAIPPLPEYVFMAWCLVKHKDNFKFTFTFMFKLYLFGFSKLHLRSLFIYFTVVHLPLYSLSYTHFFILWPIIYLGANFSVNFSTSLSSILHHCGRLILSDIHLFLYVPLTVVKLLHTSDCNIFLYVTVVDSRIHPFVVDLIIRNIMTIHLFFQPTNFYA